QLSARQPPLPEPRPPTAQRPAFRSAPAAVPVPAERTEPDPAAGTGPAAAERAAAGPAAGTPAGRPVRGPAAGDPTWAAAIRTAGAGWPARPPAAGPTRAGRYAGVPRRQSAAVLGFPASERDTASWWGPVSDRLPALCLPSRLSRSGWPPGRGRHPPGRYRIAARRHGCLLRSG